jgi:hypothetical protein
MGSRQATVDEWVERVQAVIREAHADGVQWSYESDYCEADDCGSCCGVTTPLAATRDDVCKQVCIY